MSVDQRSVVKEHILPIWVQPWTPRKFLKQRSVFVLKSIVPSTSEYLPKGLADAKLVDIEIPMLMRLHEHSFDFKSLWFLRRFRVFFQIAFDNRGIEGSVVIQILWLIVFRLLRPANVAKHQKVVNSITLLRITRDHIPRLWYFGWQPEAARLRWREFIVTCQFPEHWICSKLLLMSLFWYANHDFMILICKKKHLASRRVVCFSETDAPG